MAACHSTDTVYAEGVTTRCIGWARAYEGTPDALLAAGLLTPELLPGAPGQHKTTARGTLDGRKVRVRRSTRGRLLVDHVYTESEREAAEAEMERERAAETAEKQVAALPATAEAYRRQALALAGFVRRSAADLVAPRGGFSFDAETVEAVRELLDEVVELIERAPVSYSQAGRLVDEARVRAEVLGDA